MENKVCPKCRKIMSGDSKWCLECGSPLDEPVENYSGYNNNRQTNANYSGYQQQNTNYTAAPVAAPARATAAPRVEPVSATAAAPKKGSKLFLILFIVMSVLFLIAAVFAVFTAVSSNGVTEGYKTKVAELQSQVDNLELENQSLESENGSLQSQVDSLNDEIKPLKKLADFVDEYVVFIENDGTDYYHKFDCSQFKGESFWVKNINAATDCYACPYCFN